MCFVINIKSFDYGKPINWSENGCANVNYGKLICTFQVFSVCDFNHGYWSLWNVVISVCAVFFHRRNLRCGPQAVLFNL